MADLELREVKKTFGRVEVLKSATLKVADGEFVVLLGPSGCGKSTLLRIIAGLEPQTRGSVVIGEQVVDDLPPQQRDIAMVFQQYALYPHLSVRENLAFGLKMRKEPSEMIESRIKEAADLLEIHQLLDRYPKELSGGQRQRVAMGRAIVRKPKLFLFDEPLSNLDARLRTSMRVELKKLHQRLGATMVYVTHDQVEAMTLGDTIVILNHGEIQQVGSPNQIYHEPENPFVASFIGNPPMNLIDGTLEPAADAYQFRAGKFTLVFEIPAMSSPIKLPAPAVLGIRPEDVKLEAPTTSHSKVKGIIEVMENLGADQIVYLLIDGHRIIARTPPQQANNVGDTVTVSLPSDKLHLFVNGHRLHRQ